jgi:hypothetical protein
VSERQATVYVDYQQRASEFSVGDLAYPLAGGATDEAQAGRVTAVWPAIGQVDIDFPWGSGRYPVEDVQRVTDIVSIPPDSEHSTVPGGAGSVGVPGGPVARTAAQALDRVSHAYVKSALYWAAKNRNYRATKAEVDGGKYACPKKCHGEGEEANYLRPANYKRQEGQSHRLLGCPSCLFLIKREDILGDPSYVEDVVDEGGIEAEWDGDMDQGFDEVRRVKQADDESATLTVKFSRRGDGSQSMSDMLAYIGKIGGHGHSFGITVDPGDSEYERKFGFDGDGADHITSVELDGQKVEVS